MKRNSSVWYDEALQKALKKMDRTYITLILWVLGVVASVALGVGRIPEMQILALAVCWSLLVFLVITPVLYMIFLPKPIRAHIRNVDELTEYERKRYLQELDENERMDRVLRKYKNSGRNNGRDGEVS